MPTGLQEPKKEVLRFPQQQICTAVVVKVLPPYDYSITAPNITAGSCQDAKRVKKGRETTEKRQKAALKRLIKQRKTAKNHAKQTRFKNRENNIKRQREVGREVSGLNGRVGISELGVLTLSYSYLYKVQKFLIGKN